MICHLARAVGLAGLLFCGPAHAAFMFEFADATTQTPANAFTVNAGGSLTIDVLLAELPGETGLETSGLATAGVRVTADTLANAAQLLAVTPNSLFDFSPQGTVESSSTGYITEGTLFNTITGPAILLGSFTFHMPGSAIAGNLTTLTTGLPRLVAGEQDNFLNDGTFIDALISNDTTTITVLGNSGPVVPEPNSFVLLASGLAGWIGRIGWRRRRALLFTLPAV